MSAHVSDSAPRLDPNAMAGIDTHAVVLEWFEGRQGRVGDLGTGQGALAAALAGRGLQVEACDAEAANFRAHGHPGVCFTVADLNGRFPYPDEHFDYLCAVEVIEHLENPRHFLRECRRTLRPGGTIVLSTPNVMSVASHLTFLLKGSLIYFSQREYASNGHITPLRLQDFRNMFAETGLRAVKVDYNAGKLPIPKLRHRLPMRAKPLRNRWLGESLLVWAAR
jgi:2-polyprenyl-3-methyl-5-hydroxy-6-metoxy-1,4-benzoquinol methylase